jgi:hypothetical protein
MLRLLTMPNHRTSKTDLVEKTMILNRMVRCPQECRLITVSILHASIPAEEILPEVEAGEFLTDFAEVGDGTLEINAIGLGFGKLK